MKILLPLIITFLTGSAALIYEVTWHRYLHNLLGTQAYATALILAVFMAGLGIGYKIFGHLANKLHQKKLIQTTALLEISIGVWGILFLFLYQIFWSTIGVIQTTKFFATLIDVGVISIFILIPTILMGGTLPLLTQGLAAGRNDYAKVHAWIYAINTFGAFVGSLAAGFYLVPSLGLAATIITAAALNVLSGLGFLYYARDCSQTKSKLSAEPSTTQATIKIKQALLLALLAGFYSLSFQTIFIRLAGLSIGPSEYAFPMIVGAFILLIALGSGILAGRTNKISLWKNQLVLFISLALLYFLIPYWPYLFHLVRGNFPSTLEFFYPYYFTVLFCFIILLAIPVATMGATMPLLFANLKSDQLELGNLVGKIYGINTIGTVLGCLFGGYYLLYFLNLDRLYLLCLALILLSLIILNPKSKILYSFPLLLILIAANHWDPKYIGIGLFHERELSEHSYEGPRKFYEHLTKTIKVVDYKDGPTTSVTILDFDPLTPEEQKSRSIMISGKSDGNTSGDEFTMKMIAHLPALLAGDSSDQVANLGFGTGMTNGALSLYPQIKQIDNIEISETVAKFAPYFDHANNNVSQDPKNNWVIADAYRHLASVDKKYSLVINGLSNPWMMGIDRLLTVEFYQIVSSKLADDGIFLQWMSLWGMSPETVRLTLNSIHAVFPHLRIFNSEQSVFVLASKQPLGAKNIENLAKRYSIPEVQADLKKLNVLAPEIILALESWLPKETWQGSELNSLDHTTLGYLAGKDFYLDTSIYLEKLFTNQEQWWKTLTTSKTSLMAEWLKYYPDPNLAFIMQASCGTSKINLVEPDWRFKRNICRDATLAMIRSGQAKAPEYLENELQILEDFQTAETVLPLTTENITQADRYLKYYLQYDSIFNPFPHKKLIWKLSNCYASDSSENLACQEKIKKALALAAVAH